MSTTEGRLGIIAGGGALPLLLAQVAPDALMLAAEGTACGLPEAALTRFRFEKMGGLFETLRAGGVTRVVMAGAIDRPKFDISQADPVFMELAPQLMAVMQAGGDDALLRFVITVFEEQGFAVVGAHDLLPQLTAPVGLVGGPEPSMAMLRDAERGRAILSALSALDVGQGCVVEQGSCLGIETAQGTDALLGYVKATPAGLRRGEGVFCKFPKVGQDLRVDMPAIGPGTLRAAADAGLSCVAIAARKVLLLEADTLPALAQELGLSLIAQDAG
ncbi:UDP-2,3-diacylglucosamine diphosphatase LpxI [Pseudooceanicola sp. CBS1P-1]|uniref:UDP-2,3-diacylglucosamine diphosphatase LpxI n=1 Tax=Pseudooceanicola albus TaxID=2692189 RepID=A0A6L7FYI2_9RHOB|nr:MULTISPECIES: UDP-2,3-diacylglucosamine diphosphatase LpxI [Pseudooceanicola]MBT9383185.1 UDP-2,3-diacylglucosamine diphosphatase LpxI [Pseudooceanicola endophyticus]MXN16492.1 UDP-2,3-diacylglucosamine diphosphatase LpxI [Pseudooceanicola albus]